MKNKIKAQIVADSISEQGHRITSFILTYPRFIHSEVMTHRLFSRNAASSRAIPFKKMVEMVKNDPFIPIAWQKDHKGMQGTEYLTDQKYIDFSIANWVTASRSAINHAKELNCPIVKFKSFDDKGEIVSNGVTKQLCNRLLEPFMWYTNLVTVTELDNFYELRCPKYHTPVSGEGFYFKSRKDCIANHSNSENLDKLNNLTEEEWWMLSESGAEIHIQALAEAMWDAQNESTPKQLKAGEWHIPFGDKIDLINLFTSPVNGLKNLCEFEIENELPARIKIATARAARLSYMTFDGEIDYAKDITLHDTLLASKHMSPFEHCARAMTDLEYYSFVKGEIPTQIDEYGIINLEMMPYSSGHPVVGFKGLNPNNGDRYGWCNNIRGFIQYRYLVEHNKR